ncbi:hypothetical protein PFNF54_02012 [Plasmodium falciparum NF54]|uniref:Uncharacterized protein n=1 Tax=Plasmodium falciparum (isolate NF54) TaxID=5843 RepID=W7JVK0_PLAFO|nr:hypothetical protein PFNF54_02012 [Plasmodium falciparum NF54]
MNKLDWSKIIFSKEGIEYIEIIKGEILKKSRINILTYIYFIEKWSNSERLILYCRKYYYNFIYNK